LHDVIDFIELLYSEDEKVAVFYIFVLEELAPLPYRIAVDQRIAWLNFEPL
jgi:hypothetical protein